MLLKFYDLSGSYLEFRDILINFHIYPPPQYTMQVDIHKRSPLQTLPNMFVQIFDMVVA